MVEFVFHGIYAVQTDSPAGQAFFFPPFPYTEGLGMSTSVWFWLLETIRGMLPSKDSLNDQEIGIVEYFVSQSTL